MELRLGHRLDEASVAGSGAASPDATIRAACRARRPGIPPLPGAPFGASSGPLLFAVLAAGGAGLVGAAWHAPGSPARAELTYAGDAALVPASTRRPRSLRQIAAEVDVLADAAKTALEEVASSRPDPPRGSPRPGRGRRDHDRGRDAAPARLAHEPARRRTGRGREYSNATLVRRPTVLAAIDAATGPRGPWRQVAARAAETADLTAAPRPARHDGPRRRRGGPAASTGSGRARSSTTPSLIVADVQSSRGPGSSRARTTPCSTSGSTATPPSTPRCRTSTPRSWTRSGNVTTTAVQTAHRGGAGLATASRPTGGRSSSSCPRSTRGGLTHAVIAIEEARGPIDDALDATAASHAARPDRGPGAALHSRDISNAAARHHSRGLQCRSRVVADQPWDVKADVLAVPILGEPAFGGPLGELDRRAGGELQSLTDFGELKGKRFKSVLAGAGEAIAGRLVAVLAGDAAELDRETVVKVGATRGAAPRGPAGPLARDLDLARWRTPSRAAPPRSRSCVARGVVEGSYDPATIYREGYAEGPPALDELILVAPGRGRRAPREGRGARRDHRRGREHRADARQPLVERRQPGGPRRGGLHPRQAARPVDRRHRAREGRPRWAWACSWPSAAAATTRRG